MDDKMYETMVFAIENYQRDTDTVEEARNAMWNDVAVFLRMLTKNDNIAVVYDDDVDIIIVQYEHNNKADDWGGYNPQWIDEDEYDDFIAYLRRTDCATDKSDE